MSRATEPQARSLGTPFFATTPVWCSCVWAHTRGGSLSLVTAVSSFFFVRANTGDAKIKKKPLSAEKKGAGRWSLVVRHARTHADSHPKEKRPRPPQRGRPENQFHISRPPVGFRGWRIRRVLCGATQKRKKRQTEQTKGKPKCLSIWAFSSHKTAARTYTKRGCSPFFLFFGTCLLTPFFLLSLVPVVSSVLFFFGEKGEASLRAQAVVLVQYKVESPLR